MQRDRKLTNSVPDRFDVLFHFKLGGEVHAGDFLILIRQQNKTVIPGLLPPSTSVAHKTGGVHSVRCDVGIVYAPNGPYTVAIMTKGITGERINIDLSLAKVSKAVWDLMTG